MKKAVILVAVVCFITLISYTISSNMQNELLDETTGVGYQGKIGEVISYLDNPIISIDDITIQYLETRSELTSTENATSTDVYVFEVSKGSKKNFKFNWSYVSGNVPPPTFFKTNKGCFALNINNDEGKMTFHGIAKMPGHLVLYKAEAENCNSKLIPNLE